MYIGLFTLLPFYAENHLMKITRVTPGIFNINQNKLIEHITISLHYMEHDLICTEPINGCKVN